MELFLKVTSIALVLVLTLQLGHLEEVSTDTPRRTIAKGWLRRPNKKHIHLREIELPSPTDLPQEEQDLSSTGELHPFSQEESDPTSPAESDPTSPRESDPSSLGESQKEEDQSSQGESGVSSQGESETSSGGIASGFVEEMETDPEDSTVLTPSSSENQKDNAPTATTQLNSDDTGSSETASETSDEIQQNAINGTEVQPPVPVPENNTTEAAGVHSGEAEDTEQNVTTTSEESIPEAPTQQATTPVTNNTSAAVTPVTNNTSAPVTPEATKTSAFVTPKTNASIPETPETSTSAPVSPEPTTISTPVTPHQANMSDKGASPSGGTAERGFASEAEKRKRKGAWGAVLGTFVAIAVVGLVAYVILKKKHHKAFSHRKLQEDFPSDPVLRLDNSEPLDLNFGRAAYYNPTLQGDNIQMSPFPKN